MTRLECVWITLSPMKLIILTLGDAVDNLTELTLATIVVLLMNLIWMKVAVRFQVLELMWLILPALMEPVQFI